LSLPTAVGKGKMKTSRLTTAVGKGGKMKTSRLTTAVGKGGKQSERSELRAPPLLPYQSLPKIVVPNLIAAAPLRAGAREARSARFACRPSQLR
jgi:hypothetical protein